MIDQYADFAERYDLPYGPAGEPDAHMTEFFRRLFVERQVRRVLDCACGTGRHLRLFHDLGCEVFGTILLRDDQERLLKAAGFRRVDFFGGYDFSPYDKTASNQMIAVAQK